MAFHRSAKNKFPAGFKFGVGSSAYQTEGNWNANGKSESIWDYQTHNYPEKFLNIGNADIACDAVNKLDQDIMNLKMLNVDFYRFSISWTRILPTGFANLINENGITYYKTLIEKLVNNGIYPVATIHHGDLPQKLQELGGWTNPIMADIFTEYARVCFANFGDLVKTWITINSPNRVAEFGYGDGSEPPFIESDGIGTYLAVHTMLLAHGKTYQLYKNSFRNQNGLIGIAIDCPWCEPYTTSLADTDAADRVMDMYVGWIAHPIFSKNSDYPEIMRQRIDSHSALQNYPQSRLPTFTSEEIALLKGSADFFGVNHFRSFHVTNANIGLEPSNDNDMGAHCFIDHRWSRTARTHQCILPWGMYNLLRWIKNTYDRPQIYITANGYASTTNDDDFNDTPRGNYIIDYLKEILRSIENDCNVVAYTYWSFMDCFEWMDGYSIRSGLFHVEFNDPDRKRKAKNSAITFRNIIMTRRLFEVPNDNRALVPIVSVHKQQTVNEDRLN